MQNSEYIKEILNLLKGVNGVFDGSIYSFSYFQNNEKENDNEMKFRPTITLTGHETIKKYNELYEGLYKNIVRNNKMTFKVFKDNTQNLIFENKFNEEELKNFVKNREEYTTNNIYKIYGLEMSKDFIRYGKYTFVKKEYIESYLKSVTTLKSTEYNEFELKLLRGDSKDTEYNFVSIVCQHKTIDNLYSTQVMSEEIKRLIYVLRFMSCMKDNRYYIDSVPFVPYSKSHFQFVNDWMTSGHDFVRKDRAISIDNEWFNQEDLGHKRLWELQDFEKSKNEIEDRILKSIEWVGKAYGEEDEKVAFLEIAFAFETLLMNDQKGIINQSIVASLSESYAFINGSSTIERIEYEKEFKSFYSERSGLVHGASSKKNDKNLNPYKMITMTIRKMLVSPPFANCSNMKELFNVFLQQKYTVN